jgi:hypothetical protein
MLLAPVRLLPDAMIKFLSHVRDTLRLLPRMEILGARFWIAS